MDRRRFILGAAAGFLLTTPLVAHAQKPERVARMGILNIGPLPSPEELAKSIATNPFWQFMKQLGWVIGQNLIVERRFGETAEQLQKGAAELVRLKVDVLFVANAGLAKILQRETTTSPIVVGRAEGDLVAAGLVASLTKPGGNITGSQVRSDELVAKRLELLKMLIPSAARLALLREDVTSAALPEIPARYEQQAAPAARSLGIDVHILRVRGASELPDAFAGMIKNRDQGVLVAASAFMFVHRRAVVDLAAAHRIVALYELQNFVEVGGLMSYGVNVAEMELRGATYVDRILRGAKPADLPIEQPTKFDLVINVKTAKALRLTIPPALLALADRVVE